MDTRIPQRPQLAYSPGQWQPPVFQEFRTQEVAPRGYGPPQLKDSAVGLLMQ